MQLIKHTPEEIGRIGKEIYDRDLRDKVMPKNKGKFLVLDINTGEFDIDEDDVAASDRLHMRLPNGEFFGLRIGYTSAYTLAGHMVEEAA